MKWLRELRDVGDLGSDFKPGVAEGHAEQMTFGTRRRQGAWAQEDPGS